VTSRPTWIAGNWKMNLLRAQARELASATVRAARAHPHVMCGVFPASTSLDVVRTQLADSSVMLGGQACHPAESGAHTGELSVAMLADAGCGAVLCGHSERRAAGISDEGVGERARAVLNQGLRALICVGEQLADREGDRTDEVLIRQLSAAFTDISADDLELVDVAYEPVWAIGTGRTATPDIAGTTHATVRSWLESRFGPAGAEPRILYGGSVKPGNARDLLGTEGVNGVLVGGAALDGESFAAIIASA